MIAFLGALTVVTQVVRGYWIRLRAELRELFG